mmetsp:Transcript_18473/g.40415  ORF Transcript_18473/g.40415 Transcript_18473/m.40415 type:complete len:247 (-) Transcript_18473:219-959(-)|eukprot:CAMPEP_0118935222 /NCGR_PEP_ID=MMETSP1169-20130426/15181_1 /TAXON_ID=36882 /ORGANISM="Pyramimonas obovata, Strain CCMP722" /LENGTH=246 /DNA_ID=CAMNT_0006878221 /DNA_START=201 /DNA_END=941 /DNA_ORIENTATION=-
MGAGVSSGNVRQNAAAIDMSRYTGPVTRSDDDGGSRTLFLATPLHEQVKQKAVASGGLVLLEVGQRGFRVLRPNTEDPLFDFPFPQVHSWGNVPNKFSFRFYDTKTKAIILYSFETSFVDELLQVIHSIIDRILTDRKDKSMSEDEFNALLSNISESPVGRLEKVKNACSLNFFTAAQGDRLVTLLENTFDKIEAAALLHYSLVDQNRFSLVLKSLEDSADRDNVLHLVAAEKARRKAAAGKSPGP